MTGCVAQGVRRMVATTDSVRAMEPTMGREEDIEKIVERGRQTRKPTPRWLWIAAVIVGGVCMAGFAIAMFGKREPMATREAATVEPRSAGGSGLGIGLVIGAGVGIVIGVSIARQRRSHSSRNKP
jgi:hypothetical protein